MAYVVASQPTRFQITLAGVLDEFLDLDTLAEGNCDLVLAFARPALFGRLAVITDLESVHHLRCIRRCPQDKRVTEWQAMFPL